MSHPITKHCSGNRHKLRYTQFVEVQMPVFSRYALEKCMKTFQETTSTWGLDLIWPKLLGYPTDKIAIIDAVQAYHPSNAHTVPGGTSQDQFIMTKRLKEFNISEVEAKGAMDADNCAARDDR
ncbi:hypothetical protein CYMTET_48860 [Cymbomonas tetramitiformis]|uniref:Uncharacterized protein n=1 Tax=Cymbomonas tetramitiformis TaxID=36881 RepID=A0AAE0BT30_9CHLO|nr:hypothetical protein CYMTET_48860 [Cymbomonas tetramitiformis]